MLATLAGVTLLCVSQVGVYADYEALKERNPPRATNASALELERLMQPLGIDLVPRGSERSQPDAMASVDWQPVWRVIRNLQGSVSGCAGPLPADAMALLETHRTQPLCRKWMES